MYRQQDIIRYMKEHPEDWNAARVTDDTLFMQYPWFKEKRKNDISHKYNWTQTEVSQMKMLRKQGCTIREIAEKMMNRSESYQIQTLRKGRKAMAKLRSGREAKTKPEASC